MAKARKQQRLIMLALMTIVIAAAIGAAFFFGKTSGIIASGKIVLKPDLISQAQGMRTLFIIVRDPSSPMPMPLGALAVTLSEDPAATVYEFKLTKDNLRMMGASEEQHPAKITVKARLDMDGLGGGDTPGDIVGQAEGVLWGEENLTIELTELITADAELPEK